MSGTATRSKGVDVRCPLQKKTEVRGRRIEGRLQTTKQLIDLLATARLAYRGWKAAPTEKSFGGHRGPPYWILATDY
jgi:hypothetical protein